MTAVLGAVAKGAAFHAHPGLGSLPVVQLPSHRQALAALLPKPWQKLQARKKPLEAKLPLHPSGHAENKHGTSPGILPRALLANTSDRSSSTWTDPSWRE